MEFPQEDHALKFPEGFENMLSVNSSDKKFSNISSHSQNLFESESSKVNGLFYEEKSEPKFDPEYLKRVEYSKILSTDTNSTRLVAKFELERKQLTKSDAVGISYELKDCKERASHGYYLFKYSFNSPKRTPINFKITDFGIELSKN